MKLVECSFFFDFEVWLGGYNLIFLIILEIQSNILRVL